MFAYHFIGNWQELISWGEIVNIWKRMMNVYDRIVRLKIVIVKLKMANDNLWKIILIRIFTK